jgi:hypothetical protein
MQFADEALILPPLHVTHQVSQNCYYIFVEKKLLTSDERQVLQLLMQ